MNPRESTSETVRRKAERMARARQKQDSFWRQLAHVGVLGWVFVLPVVAGAVLGRLLGRFTGVRHVDVALILAGVLAGGYSVYRQIKRSLEDGT